jgi:DNA-binding NtrC family response regulator
MDIYKNRALGNGEPSGSHLLDNWVFLASHSLSPLLVCGEGTTSNEIIAKAIHQEGPRCQKPLVWVDCGNLSEKSLEEGLRNAQGGTLCLKGIDTLNPILQGKLRSILQESKLPTFGQFPEEKLDVRVLATSKYNLNQLVMEGRLREDLQRLFAEIPMGAVSKTENGALIGDQPTLYELETRYIEIILKQTGGRKDKASQILGINRRTLYRKEREYGWVVQVKAPEKELSLPLAS